MGLRDASRTNVMSGHDDAFKALSGAMEAKMDTQMTPTVLLIDDNAIQAATRQTILRRAGYFVIAVLNPRRALEQLQSSEYPGEVGLVITDHTMPEMSGAAFVKAMRVTHPKVPVMVISGLEDAEAEYEGMNVLFRMKPLMPDDLLANVHTLLKPGVQPVA